MTKIPFSSFTPPKPGTFTPGQRRLLSANYPLIASDLALRGVERILNELFIDAERYGLMPNYKSATTAIAATKKQLNRTSALLRTLTRSDADTTRTFIALELAAMLTTMKAGNHISIEQVDDALGTLDVALDLIVERLSARHGGRNGAPPEVALDIWIERMICLWQSLGGETPRTWAPVKADNEYTDETADMKSSGRRKNELIDLLVDLVSIADASFMPGGQKLKPRLGKALTASAIGQRTYHVEVAWKQGTLRKRRRRRCEVYRFCTSVLSARPPESGSVLARDKEARANDERDSRRLRRPTDSKKR